MKTVPVISALFLTACVTINIYFPAAAAEQVADEIIKGIQSEKNTGSEPPQGQLPQSRSDSLFIVINQWGQNALDFIFPAAHAANADLSVNTAEIRQLRARMKSRFSALKPFYQAGQVGIKSDGLLTIRVAVALKHRNKVNKLVAAENKDREALYRAIANANGHSEWYAQIKSTFATRWVGNAQAGWWYQSGGSGWKQK